MMCGTQVDTDYLLALVRTCEMRSKPLQAAIGGPIRFGSGHTYIVLFIFLFDDGLLTWIELDTRIPVRFGGSS